MPIQIKYGFIVCLSLNRIGYHLLHTAQSGNVLSLSLLVHQCVHTAQRSEGRVTVTVADRYIQRLTYNKRRLPRCANMANRSSSLCFLPLDRFARGRRRHHSGRELAKAFGSWTLLFVGLHTL